MEGCLLTGTGAQALLETLTEGAEGLRNRLEIMEAAKRRAIWAADEAINSTTSPDVIRAAKLTLVVDNGGGDHAA